MSNPRRRTRGCMRVTSRRAADRGLLHECVAVAGQQRRLQQQDVGRQGKRKMSGGKARDARRGLEHFTASWSKKFAY